jgi:hypothetical protein
MVVRVSQAFAEWGMAQDSFFAWTATAGILARGRAAGLSPAESPGMETAPCLSGPPRRSCHGREGEASL